MSEQFKPTLCVDFDGVIHSYERGWQGGEIYGTLVPGFIAWIQEAKQHFIIVVYSSRSRDQEMIRRMIAWLRTQLAERFIPSEIDQLLSDVVFMHEKPAAWLTIDDRCIRFDGNWDAPELQPKAMLAFKPWMHREPKGA